MSESHSSILFEAVTPLGFTVHVSHEYWRLITTVKHPIMMGHENEVKTVLSFPDEIRRSRSDPNVYLFYKNQNARRWVCAVTKQTGQTGFLITAYPTDAIKEGERIWPT